MGEIGMRGDAFVETRERGGGMACARERGREGVERPGLGGAAQLHEAHRKIAMGGGQRGVEGEDALVKFDGADEIAPARALAGAFVKLRRLVGLHGGGGRPRNVRDAVADRHCHAGVKKRELLAEARDPRLL